MPAKSERQHRFMGLALALERGDVSPKEVGPAVRQASSSMTEKQLRDYARKPNGMMSKR